MLLQMSNERLEELRGTGNDEFTRYPLDAEQREKEQRIKAMIERIPEEKRTEKLEEKAAELLNTANVTQREIDDMTVGTYDLMYILGNSLRRLYAGENQVTEYHDWVQAEEKIEVALKTDGVEQHELDAKHGYVGYLDQRETELKLVISLYSGAALYGNKHYSEKAREELKFLTFKLNELRRLRTKMQATPDKTDTQERAERKMIETGQAYLLYKSGMLASEFEGDTADRIFAIKPPTRSVTESHNRINQLENNALTMRKLLEAYRMGKSRDEIEHEISVEQMNELEPRGYVREKISRLKGFVKDHFLELDRGGRQSA